jgi:ketosteroid isomerase-like protein
MSEDKIQLIREALESSGGQGLRETAETYWHPEVEYVEDPRWPGASSYKGRAAVLRCFQAYMEALGADGDLGITVERVLDGGARQVALVRVRTRGVSSGVEQEHLWGYVVEVHRGRISYFRAYYEPAEALEAVGLRE